MFNNDLYAANTSAGRDVRKCPGGTSDERLARIPKRIREIGIRKAIGATFGSIFFQVLAQSVVIAAIAVI